MNIVPGRIHLQAIVVSLDPDKIPDGAPRGQVMMSGPGTLGIAEPDSTSYLFSSSLKEKLNSDVEKFMKVI